MENIKLNIQKFASGSIGFTTDGPMTGLINWSSTVVGSTAQEKAQNNQSDVTVTIYVRRTSSWTQGNFTGSTTIDGTSQGFDINKYVQTDWVALSTQTKRVTHNNDGSKTINISGIIHGPTGTSLEGRTSSGSQTVTLDKIPRYATSNQSLKSKTETSITMNWSSDNTCDYIWYSTNNGTNWTAVGGVNSTSGSYTISNLSANTTYNIKTRVRRKDSQLTTDSSASAIATYRYPYCSSTNKNFIIGQSVTISIYNPLKRDVKIQMWSHTSQGFVSDLIDVNTGNKDSYTGFDDVTTKLYQSIPNAKSSAYNIDVWTGSHKEVNTVGNYSVDETANKPVFNDFTYADINSTTTALTGDDQKVIQGYSNIQATISVANKATAQHYATMDRYDLIIQGNATQSASYSDSEDVTIVVNNANSGSIKVNAVDSRNIPKEVPKTATLIPYTNIQRGNISLTRAGNVGEATTLAFNGTLWEGDFGVVTNTITSVQYRYKSTAAGSSWSSYASLTPPTPSGNSYSFSGLIAGDEGNTGFSVDNSFNIEVVVSDRLSSITFTATLGTGIPHVAVADDGVAIKQPYDTNDDSVLQVNGTASVSKNLKIPKNSTAGYGLTNSDGASIIRDWGNMAVTVDATGGDLYLGYANTSSVDILNGKAHFTSNGLDFRNNNNGSIEWKENGYGDKFRIIPYFSGADDDNKLRIQGTVGGSGTDPTNWADLLTISGKTGILSATNFTYSTSETVIGKWIDNRPIYRRVLTYNSPFSQRQTLSFSSIANFKEYTKIEGLLYRKDGYTLPLPTGNIIDDWTGVLYDFNSSSFGLYIGNELLNKTSKIVVIIEYTKR